MESASPPVSPTVVAKILITQNMRVTRGTLLIVGTIIPRRRWCPEARPMASVTKGNPPETRGHHGEHAPDVPAGCGGTMTTSTGSAPTIIIQARTRGNGLRSNDQRV